MSEQRDGGEPPDLPLADTGSGEGIDPDVVEVARGGVPVLWTEAPEPVVGALLVRVGRADETLRTAGLTHLVEHLALFEVGRRPFQYNGQVEVAQTWFYAAGTVEEVAGFLGEVAAGLRELPLDRVDREKRILATEALRGQGGPDERLLGLRYGPVGYGLANHVELGLGWVGREEVAAWASERFTVRNAVAWLTAEPPESLDLSLAPGPRSDVPAPEPIPSLSTPCQLAEGSGGVAMSFVGSRTAALHAGSLIAAERAHARLRREAAVSYAPNVAYFPLDGRVAHVVLNADCKDQEAGGVRDELLRILDDLAEHGPSEAELEWDRMLLERALNESGWAPGLLDTTARSILSGAPPTSRAKLLREREELTREQVASALREAAESLLVLVPAGVSTRAARALAEYDVVNRTPLGGRRFPVVPLWAQWGERSEILVGPVGLEYRVTDPWKTMSWPFAECVAGVRLLSGSLNVIDRGGATVTVYPDRYVDGHDALGMILDALGDERIVPLTERERELEPVVHGQLGDRVGRVAPEVDVLPVILGDAEEVRVLAEAQRGDQVGLVVVTEHRFLFLFLGTLQQDIFEQPLATISAEVKGLVSKRLVVSHDGRATEFRNVEPGGKIEAIADALVGG